MPEMNGFDGIVAIRGEFPDAKIVVLTTYKGDAVKSRVKSILSKLGANDRTHAAMIGLKRGIIEL